MKRRRIAHKAVQAPTTMTAISKWWKDQHLKTTHLMRKKKTRILVMQPQTLPLPLLVHRIARIQQLVSQELYLTQHLKDKVDHQMLHSPNQEKRLNNFLSKKPSRRPMN